MEDPLSRIRDNFFSGYYERCLHLAEGASSRANELEKAELFSLTCRSETALGREKGNTPGPTHMGTSVIATINFIDYWNAETKEQRKLQIDNLKERAKTGDPVARFLASSALICPGDGNDVSEALRLANQGPAETKLLRLMELILIDRYDLAEEAAREMMSKNDDAVLSKLASVMVSMVTGNYEEAYLTFGDIAVQCNEGEETSDNGSALVLNGKAVANMERRHWDEAIEDLLNAHKAAPYSIDTLANLVTCYQWTKDAEQLKIHLDLLRQLAPEHPLVKDLDDICNAFLRFKGSHGGN